MQSENVSNLATSILFISVNLTSLHVNEMQSENVSMFGVESFAAGSTKKQVT